MDKACLLLIECVQQLSRCQSLEELIIIVRSAARKLANADGATFVLKEGDLCHYVDEDAISPLFKGGRFPADICVSGAAMRTASTIVIPDIYQDDRIPLDIYRPTFVKSMCMTPIRRLSPIGSIGVYWQKLHDCTLEEQELLSALADSCSIAIENLNLKVQLEVRLEQITRLSALKDEFLRNISHELKTPLNIILGWAELLSSGPADAEELDEGLRSIEESCKRQERIIRELLDCSDLLEGQIELHPKSFRLSTLIAPVLNTFKLAVEAKHLTIEEIHVSAEERVHADYGRCKDILWQLLSNAIKFSPLGATIRIRFTSDEGYSGIAIEDDGLGIADSFLPRVFDLFSQEDPGLNRAHQGIGLGLPLSRYLIEAQGGSLKVSSEGRSKGTTASFQLPIAAHGYVTRRGHDSHFMAQMLHELVEVNTAI